MSELLRSAFGYFNNPSAGSGTAPPPGSQTHHPSPHQHGGGGGSADEGSVVGDVINFSCDDQKRSVRIMKAIAEGGFSYVYRGVDTSSGELVAIKKMLAPDPDALKAIEQEVEFMRQFHHEHIIKFFGSIIRPSGRLKEYFIAMEYCQVQLPTPPLRLQHTTQIFAQTCKAIKYLHDFGIVHRDIKLENILIGSDGLVKLVDFGSATMEKIYPTQDWSMSKRTLVEEQIAQKTTPMYRAPEMLDLWSNHPIDEHSDMWALGCLLFALNFGQHPFQDSNKLAIVNANYNLPKNVSSSNPVVCVIRGLLKVNPLERMTIGQIYDVLQSIAESEQFSLNGKLPFQPATSPTIPTTANLNSNVGNGAPQPASRPPPPPHQPHHSSSQGAGPIAGGGLLSSIKGVGSSFLKNIKESSQQYMYGGPQAPGSAPDSAPPPRRPPPPASHSHQPPGRPAPPSPRQPSKSQHLEFENREYDMMQRQHQPPPHRPAPPKPPPPRASPVPEPVIETVGNLLDISLDPSINQASNTTQPSTNSDLLEDLFGSAPSTTATSTTPPTNNNFADDLLWGSSNMSNNRTNPSAPSFSSNKPAANAEVNLLGDTTDPFVSLLGNAASSVPTNTFTQPLFGMKSDFGAVPPPLIQPSGGSGTLPTSASFQNLNFPKNPSPPTPAGGMDLLGPNKSSIPKNSSTPNLLSDLIMDDLMGTAAKMSIGGGGATAAGAVPQSAAAANSGNKSNPAVNQFGNGNGGANNKPNYNRHQIFDASPTNPGEKKQTLNDAFGDILSSQGFASAKGGQQSKTINDLRKIEMMQNPNIDPDQLKVNEWREGKKKNIRALLASLHTITWDGCNWEETNMSQMITPAQVKKVYRKACLAIHPDKQMGKDWEQLAKLLFVELNEAWAAFEEAQQT